MDNNGCLTHLIDGDGILHVGWLDHFMKDVNGLSYAVVAIMGPHSSGKRTLMTHLFGTNFRDMDASMGRSQTTKGIWMARVVGTEPCTFVLDLEGTDGRERGEEVIIDTQCSLFALSLSDIMMINTCHDIGLEEVMKTVFQAITRVRSSRKTTLLFVIHDRTGVCSPLELEDIQKIWDSVPKSEDWRETQLCDVFNVEVVALSSFEEKEEQFREQVASLRQRFNHSINPGGLAGDRHGVVPGSCFSFSAELLWLKIIKNQNINLDVHEDLIARLSCDAIVKELLSSFRKNVKWCELKVEVQTQLVPSFGKKLTSIIDDCLKEYDVKANFFDKDFRTAKRKHLQDELLQLVKPAQQYMLGHIHSGTLAKFKEVFSNDGKDVSAAAVDCTKKQCMLQFDQEARGVHIEQSNWDSSEVRNKLSQDIDAHTKSIWPANFPEDTSIYGLNSPVMSLTESDTGRNVADVEDEVHLLAPEGSGGDPTSDYPWAYHFRDDQGHERVVCTVCRVFGKKGPKFPYSGAGSTQTGDRALMLHSDSKNHKDAEKQQRATNSNGGSVMEEKQHPRPADALVKQFYVILNQFAENLTKFYQESILQGWAEFVSAK